MRVEEIIATLVESPSPPSSAIHFDVLDEYVGFALHRAALVLAREFELHMGEVRPAVFNALVLIGANPGVTQSELAAALMLDKGTAAHLLRDLEEQGWIERRNRLSDRRRKGVYLSPRGVQEAARLKARVRKLVTRVQSLYGPDEYPELTRLLNRIVRAGEARTERN